MRLKKNYERTIHTSKYIQKKLIPPTRPQGGQQLQRNFNSICRDLVNNPTAFEVYFFLFFVCDARLDGGSAHGNCKEKTVWIEVFWGKLRIVTLHNHHHLQRSTERDLFRNFESCFFSDVFSEFSNHKWNYFRLIFEFASRPQYYSVSTSLWPRISIFLPSLRGFPFWFKINFWIQMDIFELFWIRIFVSERMIPNIQLDPGWNLVVHAHF